MSLETTAETFISADVETSGRLPARFQSALSQTHNALDDPRAQADTFSKMLVERAQPG